MIFGRVSQVIQMQFGCYYPKSMYWAPLLGKEIATRSMPHHENGRQRNFNNFWPFIISNQTAMRRTLSIYDDLTVCLGQHGHELIVASL